MYSDEHKKYLKQLKIKKISIRLIQILIIVSFVIIWQLCADLHIINTFITSSPKDVIQTISNLIKSGDLWKHIGITFYETMISFLLGTFIGIWIAIIFWWNHFIAKVMDPYLTILNSLPKVALGPILIIWAGAGMRSIILINVYDGFKQTDIHKITLLKSFKAKKWQIFLYAILPSNFSTIISSLKICISMSLIGVIMGEFLVSKEGLGYLIMYGSQVFNLNLVMSGIILLCILATCMYYTVCYIEKKLIKHD